MESETQNGPKFGPQIEFSKSINPKPKLDSNQTRKSIIENSTRLNLGCTWLELHFENVNVKNIFDNRL